MHSKRFKIFSLFLAFTLLCLLIISATVSADIHPYGAPTPPSVYYSFDGSNAYEDMSGNGNTITPVGSATTATGIRYQGLNFGGWGSANDSGSLNFGTGDFSMAFWIKTSSNGEILYKMLDYVGYRVSISSGKLLMQFNDQDKRLVFCYDNNTKTINDNQWHFIAITVDRDSQTGLKFYIDNELEASIDATYASGDISNTSDLLIKSGSTGTIDEVRLYDREITVEEINNLFSDYYKNFDLNFDNLFHETSGNGNSSYCSPDNFNFCEGKNDEGLAFSASQERLSIPNNPELNFGTGDFCVSFWIKTTQTNSSVLLDKKSSYPTYDGYKIGLNSGQLYIMLNSSGYYFSNSVSDGRWHFVTFSILRDFDNGVMLYIDGRKYSGFSTISIRGKNISSTKDLIIGNSQPDTNNAPFEGALDEITFYGKSLTNVEILSMYQAYLNYTPSTPTAAPTSTPTPTATSTSTPRPTYTPGPTYTPTPRPSPTPIIVPSVSPFAGWTKQQVLDKWQDLKPTYTGDPFIEYPVLTVPYSSGQLQPGFANDGINYFNFIRFLAGVPSDVEIDSVLAEQEQCGATIMAINEDITHFQPKPAGMDAEFYQKAYDACRSSNTSSGPKTLPDSIKGWMDDTGSYSLGHRMYTLTPEMKKTAFGHATKYEEVGGFTFLKTYSLAYDFDTSRTEPFSFNFVSWPANGYFPLNVFRQDTHWSINLSRAIYKDPQVNDLNVTVTKENTGEEWTLNYGGNQGSLDVPGSTMWSTTTISFIPNNVTCDDGDIYHIELTGLKYVDGTAAATIEYTVKFFDLND